MRKAILLLSLSVMFTYCVDDDNVLQYNNDNYQYDWSIVFFEKDVFIYDIEFYNDTEGLAVGYKGNGLYASGSLIDGTKGVIYKTTDLGQNWELLFEYENTIFDDIMMVDESTGWLLSYNGIMKTTNGGADWELKREVITGKFQGRDILWLNGREGIITQGNLFEGIYVTEDGGENWIKSNWSTVLNDDIIYIYDMQRIDESTIALVGYQNESGNNNSLYSCFALISTNNGESWRKSIFDNKNYLSMTFYAIDKHQMKILNSYYTLSTNNGGYLWKKHQNKYNNNIPYSSYFLSSLHGWMITDDGFLLETTDGGQNWESMMTNDVINISFVNNSIGFIWGHNISRTTNGGERIKIEN